MSLFHKKKAEKQDSVKDESSKGAGSTPRRRGGKLHTRRRQKNLVQQMKITESVPATVIDAIHGDRSVVSSDKDFVRAPALKFSDGTYYPVFIFDAETMEKAGLGGRDKHIKQIFGRLSVGLKTSSGATGFLPVATEESLRQSFLGILPMHDAFEVLRGWDPINDYQPGWKVGLVRIDNDELNLTKTETVLTMPEWWQFVNSKLNLIVENDRLKKSIDVPTTSDPLATTAQEEAGAEGENENHLAASAYLPTGEFDDDDEPASNSNISSFVNSNGQGQPSEDSGNSTEGFTIPDLNSVPGGNGNADDAVTDDLDDDDEESTTTVIENQGSTAAQQAMNDAVSGQNQQSQQAPVPSQGPVARSEEERDIPADNQNVGNVQQNQQSQDNAYQVSTSRDDLDARNAILSSSTATLNDLQVSISDLDFMNAYMKTLKVEKIPLLDESNDPSGRIHHENVLRQHANIELESELQDRKNHLRAWFEKQRSSILTQLQQTAQDENSDLYQAQSRMQELVDELSDNNALRERAMNAIQQDLNNADDNFNKAYQDAKLQALASVDVQFNDRRLRHEDAKRQMIDEAIAQQKDTLATNLNQAKDRVRQAAQTAASRSYQALMEQGSNQAKFAQNQLKKLRRQLLDNLNAQEEQERQSENRRAANDADVARHDVTLAQLREQLKRVEHESDLRVKQAKDNAEVQVKSVKSQAEIARRNAISQFKNDAATLRSENEKLNKQLQNLQDKFSSSLDERDAKWEDKVNEVKRSSQEELQKADRSNRRFTRWVVVGLVGVGLIGGGVGYMGGALHATKSQPTTTQQSNNNNDSHGNSPVIVQVPQSGNSNSNDSNHSNSNKTSSHRNDSDSHSNSDESSNPTINGSSASMK